MEDNFFYAANYLRQSEDTPPDSTTPKEPAFSATGDDYAQPSIDLNEQLVRNKPATFFLRVNSDAMIGSGIHQGDVVIVDRSLPSRSGKVIIALLDGEMLIRRLEITGGTKRLIPSTKKLSTIEINDAHSFTVWGVVTYVIHNL
ncbi:MAG: LexA family protein [Flavisolibacter sp.]